MLHDGKSQCKSLFSNLWTRICHPGGFARNFSIYLTATLLNQSLPFLLIPILTRHLSPEQYGTLALFNIVFVLSKALVGGAMVNAVSREFFRLDQQQMAAVFPNLLGLLAANTLVVVALAAAASGHLAEWLQIPAFWLIVTPLAGGFGVIHLLNCTLLRNLKQPLQFGVFQIAQTALDLSLSLVLVVAFAWGWEGRATGMTVACVVAALLAVGNMIRRGYWRPELDWAVWRRAALVTLPLIPNSVFVIVMMHSGKVFLNAGFDRAEVGLYAVGQQVAMIVHFLGQAFLLGWGPFAFEILARQEENAVRCILRSTVAFSVGILIVAFAVFLGAGLVLYLMTTPEYYGAQSFVGWMAAGYAFCSVYHLFTPMLVHRDQQHHIAVISGLGAGVNILLNVLLIREIGPTGAAVAFLATYVFMCALMIAYVQKIFQPPWREVFRLRDWVVSPESNKVADS